MKSMCFRLLLLAALIAAPTACNATPPSPLAESATPTPQATPVQTPLLPEKAGFTGRIVTTQGDKPIASTVVRLAQVHRGTGDEGAFILDGASSPGTVTTSAGYFAFENLDPIECVMVVGDVMGAYVIVSGENGRARVWTLSPNTYLDAGTVRVTLPQ